MGTGDLIEHLSAQDALALYRMVAQCSIGSWVMGGWGVDALLGRETRPHHDLDLLVSFDDLGQFQNLLREREFARRLIWEDENRWIDVRGVASPTAYVESDGQGRELDIHVIQLIPGHPPTPLCDVPWIFDQHSLDGVGTISGTPVRCVSAETQVQMHSGYDLPAHHGRDLEELRALVAAATPESRT